MFSHVSPKRVVCEANLVLEIAPHVHDDLTLLRIHPTGAKHGWGRIGTSRR